MLIRQLAAANDEPGTRVEQQVHNLISGSRTTSLSSSAAASWRCARSWKTKPDWVETSTMNKEGAVMKFLGEEADDSRTGFFFFSRRYSYSASIFSDRPDFRSSLSFPPLSLTVFACSFFSHHV